MLDLDGTLVDRDRALRRWLAHRAGLRHAESISALLELDLADDRSLVQLCIRLTGEQRVRSRDPVDLARQIRVELPDFIEPNPELLAALDRLQTDPDLTCAVVSNGGSATQRDKADAAGIRLESFAEVTISSEFGLAKPDPAVFRAPLSKLGFAAEDTLMIGDDPSRDITGAAQIGIATVWIGHGRSYPADPELLPPTQIVETFVEAVEWVRGLKSDRRGSPTDPGR